MNPEMPQTGDYIARFCREVTRRYDIDGIHLDYIRYPETWKLKVSREQGRRNITDIVRKIHHAVKAEKPWVKLSCSPVGKYDDLARFRSGGWNANTAVCQDAQGWLRDGLMDALFPMMAGAQLWPTGGCRTRRLYAPPEGAQLESRCHQPRDERAAQPQHGHHLLPQ